MSRISRAGNATSAARIVVGLSTILRHTRDHILVPRSSRSSRPARSNIDRSIDRVLMNTGRVTGLISRFAFVTGKMLPARRSALRLLTGSIGERGSDVEPIERVSGTRLAWISGEAKLQTRAEPPSTRSKTVVVDGEARLQINSRHFFGEVLL